MRYFFHIGYHGTAYQGWQRHPQANNIQAVFENILTQILHEPVSVMGCGRTDAHVHASQFFFHVDIVKTWDYDLLFRINKNLPDDIAVFDIIPVNDWQHARFDATARSYDYFLHTYKDPFLSRFSSYYREHNLQFDKMMRAASLLTRYNDYRAFCTTPDDNRNTLCQVTSAQLYMNAAGDRLRFNITANRFLGKMIRIIMYNLIEVGRGEQSIDEMEQKLITRQSKPVMPAYPQGLYLSKVTYPYLDLPPRTTFTTMLQKDIDLALPGMV